MKQALLACFLCLVLAEPVSAGLFSKRSETQKPKHNRRALVHEVMDAATWATPSMAEGIIEFFNRRTKRLSGKSNDADLLFLIIEYRTLALGGVVRREGPMLTVELNYVPERFELASLRQSLDCIVEQDGSRLVLYIRDTAERSLSRRRRNDVRPTLDPRRVISRLTQEGSPFSSVTQLR